MTIAVGSALIICLLPVFSESDYESGFVSFSLISEPMTILTDIEWCCARGFCGNHTIFWCPSSSSSDPSFHVAWNGFWETIF